MEFSAAEKIKSLLDTNVASHLDISDSQYFTCIRVTSDRLITLMKLLRDEMGINYLANLTSVDYGDEFELVYHLYSLPDSGKKIAVKTRVDRDKAEIASLCSIYPGVDWQEREVYDLMGIRFNGHPNLIRVLLPADFEGHPLRKDFRKEA